MDEKINEESNEPLNPMSANFRTPLKVKCKLLIFGAFVAMSTIFQMGYSNAYVNTAVDSFRDYLNISLAEYGVEMSTDSYTWLWTTVLNVWFVGFAFGSWIAVPLNDRNGRKVSLLISNGSTFFSVGIMSLAIAYHSPTFLIFGRLASAISSGIAMCSLVLFLQECAPTEMRGLMSFYAELSFVVMNMLGSVAGMSTVLGPYLLHLVAVALIPSAIAVAILIPSPESPKFLLLKRKDRDAAVNAISFYRGAKEECEVASILGSIELEAATSSNGQSSLIEIFRSYHLRKGLLLGIAALQLTVAIWPMIYFTTDFLRRANISVTLAEQATSASLIISTVATVCGMFVVELAGRRPMFLGFSALSVFALILFVACATLQPMYDPLKYGCIAATIVYGISYSIATGPIAWFITAELSPMEYRSQMQSLALVLNQLCALAFCFITLPLYNLINAFALVPLFILPAIVCLTFLFFNLPETKGKEIYEIIEKLKQKPQVENKEGDERH